MNQGREILNTLYKFTLIGKKNGEKSIFTYVHHVSIELIEKNLHVRAPLLFKPALLKGQL